MDFVQERYLKDKYIGDMDLIKDLGDGRIAPAIAQLKNNLDEEISKKVNVVYNPETDYIEVIYNGVSTKVLKVGLKQFNLLVDGVVASGTTWERNSYATTSFNGDYLIIGTNNSSTYGHYRCKVDVTNYSKAIFVVKSYPTMFVGNSIGVYADMSSTSPIVGQSSIPTSQTTYELNISSLTGVKYVGATSFGNAGNYYIAIKSIVLM